MAHSSNYLQVHPRLVEGCALQTYHHGCSLCSHQLCFKSLRFLAHAPATLSIWSSISLPRLTAPLCRWMPATCSREGREGPPLALSLSLSPSLSLSLSLFLSLSLSLSLCLSLGLSLSLSLCLSLYLYLSISLCLSLASCSYMYISVLWCTTL